PAAEAGAPAAEAGTAAADAGPGTPPPGGGMQLLASLMGGAGPAAPAAAPRESPSLDLLRAAGRQLLAQEDEAVLSRALGAAEVAEALSEAKATGPMSDAPAPSSAPSVVVPPYDPADPCGAFVPMLFACLQSELGETLGAEELAEATADCRAEFAGWSDERKAGLRACVAEPDCAARLACVTELDDDVSGAGGDTPATGATIGPLPPNADFCTKLAYRTTECMNLPAGSEVLQPQIEECRRELGSIPVEMREQWETCFDRPCDQLFDCMSNIDPGGVELSDRPVSTTSIGDPGALGPQPPDPARIAGLPPQVHQLCTQFTAKFDSCWEALVGEAAGTDDPATLAAMAGARAEMLKAVNDACLQAAVESPAVFETTFGLFRPCFAVPCAQFQDCLMNAATNVGAGAGAAP
ncbi:MAG: hypothetical protein JXB32_21690, partial [Deltaproteobacteria bacterium]|nr:hypothetical protein [Deltaproteobacteria bacterium]